MTDDTTTLIARLAKMADRSRHFQKLWDQWFGTQPQTSACDLHGTVTECDLDASRRESFRREEMVALFAACPACVADERVRAQSKQLVEHGVPLILAHASFDNFICRTPEDERILADAREFALRPSPRGFMLMYGPVGNGKSHLAVAVARAMSVRCRFITHNGLLKKLRDTYRSDRAEDIVESCKRVRLLILDEIGLSAGGRDELPMLHEILGERHNSRKPTVLTSNLARADIEATLGERMSDRLKESGFKLLNFNGESMRRLAKDKY